MKNWATASWWKTRKAFTASIPPNAPNRVDGALAEKGRFPCRQRCGTGTTPAFYSTCLGRAHILVEPLDGARPGLRRRRPIVAFRRGVVEEAMHRIRIDMAFIADIVFLQRRF